MKQRGKECLLCAACALMVALLFATGVLNQQKVWPDLQLRYAQDKTAWRTGEGDAYGVVSSGPYLNLSPGRYRIKWRMDGDGANRIRLQSTNDATITPAVIETVPGKWEDEAWFELEDPAHSFSVEIEFCEGTELEVHTVRLYSPEYTDRTFSVSAALIAACVLLILHGRGRLDRQRRQTLLLLGAAVLLASLPCLREDAPLALDTEFHAARIMNLADGLRAGQFPVRVGGFSYNGYGAVTSVFYPDTFLYPAALMSLAGASTAYILNALSVAIGALTAWTMYTAAKRMLGGRKEALCAAILYVLAKYRLRDMYYTFMVGEMLAMAFLPLFLLGLWEVLEGEPKRWPVLALAAAAIFRSHMVATLLCALVALAACVAFARRIVRQGRLRPLLKACALVLLLSVNRLVPLIDVYVSGVTTAVVQFGFEDAALDVAQALGPDGFIGLALLIGVLAALCAKAREGEARLTRDIRLFAAAGALAALLATSVVPWGPVVKLTRGLVTVMQFPWRFMMPATAFLALCAGYGYARWMDGEGNRAALMALLVAALSVSPYLSDVLEDSHALEFGQGPNAFMIYPEYQFENTDFELTRSRAPIASEGLTLEEYEKDGTRVTAKLSAETDATLALPLFAFDGYAAEVDGERIATRRGENNRLTLCVPAGTDGELRVWFAGKPLWRVADGVSALAALFMLAAWLQKRASEATKSHGRKGEWSDA